MGDPLIDDSWPIEKGITMSILQNPLRTHVHSTGETRLVIPAHWHAMHDEHHVVLKGSVIITRDGVKKVVRPEDGPSLTRRGVVHSIEVPAGEEVIIEETTLQSVEVTEQKIYFFRNLFSPKTNQSFLAVMQVFYYGDGYPKLLPTGRWFERLFVVVMGGWLAPLLGYQLADKRLTGMDPNRFPPKKTD